MMPMEAPVRGRIAVLSLHSSPLDQPGTGDSGGMNVYVDAVARRLAAEGVEVDVYTRCAGRGVPEVEEPAPGFRVIQVPAGPCAPVAKDVLPGLVPPFADALLDRGRAYDLVHAHYWLSGQAAASAARRWGVPLVATFHTLARVKNLALPEDPEPPVRVGGERAVVAQADRILASTPGEAADLHRLYDASPARIRVVPPGVDMSLFRPLGRDGARQRLGLGGRRVLLFVGRFQPTKGPDLAVRTLGEVVRRAPSSDVVLAMVGGPSGPDGSTENLRSLAAAEGVGDRVVFLPPMPHRDLPSIYAAADAVLMPSRSESFGLVALEAQACGVPVIAAAVGGLRSVADDGVTGYLVPEQDPGSYAERVLAILGDRGRAGRLSRAAVRRARAFPWDATAGRTLSVYAEVVPGLSQASA
jgi:D-inositol-3-phosphate glycosyltransferase